MPSNCRYLRTRLQIEYLRLVNWSEVAGLIEYKDGQDLPDSLKTDRLVLVAILTEIRALMDDFANLNGKYKDHLRPDKGDDAKKEAAELDLVTEFSNISLEYEKKVVARKYLRGTNTIINHMRMAKDIAKNPKRLIWVAFDEQVFVKLLGRLTELNDYLQELLHGNQARKLEQVTSQTYMEMVQVRSSVEELKHLVMAAMLLEDRGHSTTSEIRRRNDQILARLADFKSLNAANEAPAAERPAEYDNIISATHLNYSQVYYEEDTASTSSRSRAQGKFFPGNGTVTHIWVEWKSYREKWSPKLDKYVPQDDNIRRVRELVALLQSAKPKEFCAPRCLGYFDDRDDAEHSEHEYRFGLVFEKPEHHQHQNPITLHELLRTTPAPSLTARIALAHKISVCILYLHAVNWLHKSFRSDSIVFFPPPSSSPANPAPDIATKPFYLTGYEYARADRPGETTTGGSDLDEWTELYVHPDYQGAGTKGTFRKTYDIYSLGILLLELAYWAPVEEVLGLDMEGVDVEEEVKGLRERLLEPPSMKETVARGAVAAAAATAKGAGANKENKKTTGVLETLKAQLGERYWTAVTSCIKGKEAFGLGKKESEVDVEVGAKLQGGFTERVTGMLEGISV
ncbi:MAG: hypothetical protein Q9222_003256 [Ikaeria aurantiellina]